MKETELRIGNLVIVDNEKCHPHLKDMPLAINGISPRPDNNHNPTHSIGLQHIEQEPNKYYESYSQFLKFVKPITLTEEWLVKFGFAEKESVSGFNYFYKYFKQSDTKGCEQDSKFSLGRKGTEVFINSKWICGVQYVHQLQNLFFALTLKELEIKEE